MGITVSIQVQTALGINVSLSYHEFTPDANATDLHFGVRGRKDRVPFI